MSIDHRAEALRLLTVAHEDKNTTFEGHNPEADRTLTEALVHANLARDEEQAARTADMRDALRLLRGREYDVRKLVSTHIAKALASREPNRWKAGRELAQALDMADCNMDEAIDARLSDDGRDPRSAWKAPASAAPADDPWAADPNVQALEAMRRVVAGHLAEMFLDGENEAVRKWARGIADELKHADVDIHDAIVRRMRGLTLGPDLSEPPF